MTIEEFVTVVKTQTSDAALRSTLAILHEPPGRVPTRKQVRISHWFNGLCRADQQMLEQALQQAAESAIFGFFAILDGERVFEYSNEKGDLELFYVRENERMLLNPKSGPQLHDIFNGLRQDDRPSARAKSRRGSD